MSWLEAAAPRFGSRVSLGGLSTHVCGVRLSSLDFLESTRQGGWLLNTWKHLHPRIDTRRKPPRPDRLHLEDAAGATSLYLRFAGSHNPHQLPSSPVVLHRKRHRTYCALIKTTHSSLAIKSCHHNLNYLLLSAVSSTESRQRRAMVASTLRRQDGDDGASRLSTAENLLHDRVFTPNNKPPCTMD
ncbi:hypothetical protein Bca4012_078938 [Brassica carinata]